MFRGLLSRVKVDLVRIYFLKLESDIKYSN